MLTAALLLFLLLLWAAPARAYPQFQLTSGAVRCSQCHVAPAGGGILTSYGRDAVGEDLSTFGGDGAFLHGAAPLPAWLALGADLRGAFVDNDVQDPNGPARAIFPMQADASGRLRLPLGVSLVGVVGLRGQVRDPDVLVPVQNYQPVTTSRVLSREHYLMFQPEVLGPYLRVGRFFAPFGLRFAEHLLYVRRDLGFDSLQETYNFSAGVIAPVWELHLSIFAPDFVRHIGSDERGVSAYLERRVADDLVVLALQARAARSPNATRYIVGGVAKVQIVPLRSLLFAEVNGVEIQFEDPTLPGRQQAVGAAGVAVLPVRGVMATFLAERNQLDLRFDNAWTALTGLFNWFPYAHFELQAMARLQMPSGGETAKTFFFQVHYFM